MKISTRYSGKSGLYACVTPLKGMREIATKLLPELPDGFELPDDIHCTLMYSREVAPQPLPVFKLLSAGEGQYQAVADSVKYWPGHDGKGYLVLCLHSEDLNLRHRQWLELGAKHSFKDYQAHITLATGLDAPISASAIKLMNLILRRNGFRVILGAECVEDIKE